MITEPVQVRPTPTSRVSLISVNAELKSIKAVRDFVASVHAGSLDEDALYLARTVAGELATNAIQHGGAESVILRTYESGEGPVVEVLDRSGSAMPELKTASEVATSGRGLLMVEMLAERWGCTPLEPGGKIVWAVIKPQR